MFLWGRVGEDDGLVSAWRQSDKMKDVHISSGQIISDILLYQAGVFITPGFIFGKNGSDYIRISLCAKPEVLRRAAEKIQDVLLSQPTENNGI